MIAGLREERVAQNTLFSRRRSRRRPQPQAQYRLPDWVWGLALGVLVVVIGGGVYLFSGAGGSSAKTCDSELASLPGKADVTAEGFQEEDVALGEVVDLLNKGDLNGAFAAFYGDVHAFTHNIDPELRAADEDAAKGLCEAVIKLEGLLEGDSPSAMAAATANLRELLRDAAETLGFSRPTG